MNEPWKFIKEVYSFKDLPIDEIPEFIFWGRSNVGKSSLTNALLQREQTIVTPIAGTTRDAIDSYLKWHGNEITLVDTAGLRKLSKIKKSLIKSITFLRSICTLKQLKQNFGIIFEWLKTL